MLLGKQVGPFEIKKEIGAGAMGTVYLAKYSNGAKVALKIIATGLEGDTLTLGRFEREITILKKLNHPNIVRYYGNGKIAGKPFYAMEFIEGETLETVMHRRGRFSWEEVVTLGQQMCAALQYAHQQGIIHRDLKPANVMLTADGEVKLTDFGIAKATNVEQLTATNCTVGTAAYMSPEQCRGERNLTAKSDLYSLGVMFYELLTGRTPFLADNILDMFMAHTKKKFDRPSRIVMDIPVWLDTLVCQLLEKDPGKRPLDADMVAKSLNMALEKAQAQRSAGADAVSANPADRPTKAGKLDEADRTAARLIKAGEFKKKLTKRRKPFYQSAWFIVLGSLAIFGSLGSLIYVVTRPESPEKLYSQAKGLWEKDRDKAREGPIQKFMDLYPERDDEQAEEIYRMAGDYDVAQQWESLQKRKKFKMDPNSPEESKAWRAVDLEEAGELVPARDGWKTLLKEGGPRKNDLKLWTWSLLAERRIAELYNIEGRLAQVKSQLKLGMNPGSVSEEDRATFATRYEVFGDLPGALRVWKSLNEQVKSDPSKRFWLLLSAKKIAELREKTSDRAQLIKDRLDAIGAEPEDAQKAVALCDEIVILFGADKDEAVAAQVRRAKELKKKLAPEPAPKKTEK